MSTIAEYLQSGLVVDIFYLTEKDQMQNRLIDYMMDGTQSLQRKYTRKTRSCLCDYNVIKVLTFIDCLRENKVLSKYYAVIMSMFNCISLFG